MPYFYFEGVKLKYKNFTENFWILIHSKNKNKDWYTKERRVTKINRPDDLSDIVFNNVDTYF